jgi:signal transduction histidine kinase
MTTSPLSLPPMKRVRQASLMNYLSLFGSFSTLVCCALPSLLVLFGMGAAVISMLTVAPWLVTMSRHKIWTFSIAGWLISLSFIMTYWVVPRLKVGEICIEDDPTTCGKVSKFSRMLLWGSAAIWSFGFFMAYILGGILDWYQLLWFRLLCGLLVLGIGYALYLLRQRRYAASIKMRFDERLEERSRLARDLHDTLLQTIQGSKLVAENARDNVQEPAARIALQHLSSWLERAVVEHRAVLKSLRSSTTEGNHLSEAFRIALEDYGADIEVTFLVSGASREMHPVARDEVFRIGYEAMVNACKHSQAKRLTVELVYDRNMLLRIKDDGKGIEPEILETGKSGHYGLIGMRERAARIGARITFVSSARGTTVTLVVPGEAIFKPS